MTGEFSGFAMSGISDAELARLELVSRPLADSVRHLIDATIRTQVDAATLAAVKEKIDCATEELSTALMPDSFGVRQTDDHQAMAWGNVVIGLRNPVAPPLAINHGADGLVWSDFTLGAAYEGPPGHVHGGVCAMILDHVLGATAHKPEGLPIPALLTSGISGARRSARCTQRHTSTGLRASRPSLAAILATPRASPSRLKPCSSTRGRVGPES